MNLDLSPLLKIKQEFRNGSRLAAYLMLKRHARLVRMGADRRLLAECVREFQAFANAGKDGE